ncbi:hypothetical protein I550_4588 [Mycobacterium intracellulare 1956]|uniref:DUF222 domain-containing protein n=1 Tax=Mycobacterium intracellulare 1956 TaxID=1299331 RepID=X8CAZ1_MYCIT|nr:hypothetical protein I550_4588 [Mycobacterium intracellulare 1956]
MSSTGLPDVDAVFDALDAEVDRACALVLDVLTVQQQLAVLERCERLRRRIPVIEHPLLNSLARQVPSQELGGGLAHALTERTLISRHEASRRIKEARDLGPRHGLTGEPLPPALPATAAAQRAGDLGAGQVAVIRKFCHQLPGWVSAAAREFAEAQLAGFGTQFGPEHLKELARGLTDALNPDGIFTDEDRARSRGVTLGNQRPDGMSELRGLITPELRATFEAVEAKLGAPGMCNPLDDIPCVEGTPSQAAIDGDTRSKAQRGHDALLAALRGLLASGELGQHNGLPASIIVTTTLAELEAAAGRALTGGAPSCR